MTLLAVSASNACSDDECDAGDTGCDGATSLYCLEREDTPSELVRTDCGKPELCKLIRQQGINGEVRRVLCALEPEPLPACSGDPWWQSVCVGDEAVECEYGYVVKRTPCAEGCAQGGPQSSCR